jgi:hypothetical protein
MPPRSNSGWEFKSQKRPSTGTFDHQETYQVTISRMVEHDLWPTNEEVEGLRSVLESFESVNRDLAMRILHYLPIAAANVRPGEWRAQGAHRLRLPSCAPLMSGGVWPSGLPWCRSRRSRFGSTARLDRRRTGRRSRHLQQRIAANFPS